MKFELVISGLCVIALKRHVALDDRPDHPDEIDIIVPAADHHTCRLSYLPGELNPDPKHPVKPALLVDAAGEVIASLDMTCRALEFSVYKNPVTEFTVHWGPVAAQKPSTLWQETWLNWIPKLEDLGFEGFSIGPKGTLPDGACARITLPPGALSSRKVLTTPDTKDYILWNFPATGAKRVLTNQVVYTADHFATLVIADAYGHKILTASRGASETLRMCLSNDMSVVPPDFLNGTNTLPHLKHLGGLQLKGQFQLPKVVEERERTGHPACMGVVFVWGP